MSKKTKHKEPIAHVNIEIVMNDDVPMDIRIAWASILPDTLGKLMNSSGATCQIELGVNQEEADALTVALEESEQNFKVLSVEAMEAMHDAAFSTSH